MLNHLFQESMIADFNSDGDMTDIIEEVPGSGVDYCGDVANEAEIWLEKEDGEKTTVGKAVITIPSKS